MSPSLNYIHPHSLLSSIHLFPIKLFLKRRPERTSILACPERGGRQIQSSDKRRTPVENEHFTGVSLESNLYEGSNHLDSQSRVRSAFSPSLSSTTTFLHSTTLVKTPKGRMASYWKEPNESDRQEKPQDERLPKEWIKDLALSQLNLSSSISLSLLDRSFYNCSLDQVIKLTAKSFRSERRREGVRKLR